GTRTNRTLAPNRIAMYGPAPLTTVRYGTLKIALAVKMLTPKGGVTAPMAACSVMITPMSTGAAPTSVAMGKKIGVRIAIATRESTNMHAAMKNADIIRSTATWDGSAPSTTSARA